MKVTIDIPRAFERRLKKLLKTLELPESEIQWQITQTFVNEQMVDLNENALWIDSYVYPDRATAARVAAKIYAHHPWRHGFQELWFMEGGKEVQDKFENRVDEDLVAASEKHRIESRTRTNAAFRRSPWYKQNRAYIRMLHDHLTELQIENCRERWEAICARRGWPCRRLKSLKKTGNTRTIDALLKEATATARFLPDERSDEDA